VQVSDTAAYERLHRDVLTSLPGVSRISSHFALRAVTAQT
ncbi:MAG: transcriptional regulator, partial [Ponticaulis sp.]|nr:transcriptional regulator [Ponticaulis sp.]